MSTDYKIACFDCKTEGPIVASASGFYGYKVWDLNDEDRKWFGHRQAIGTHEGHDLRIVHEQAELPWKAEPATSETEKKTDI